MEKAQKRIRRSPLRVAASRLSPPSTSACLTLGHAVLSASYQPTDAVSEEPVLTIDHSTTYPADAAQVEKPFVGIQRFDAQATFLYAGSTERL